MPTFRNIIFFTILCLTFSNNLNAAFIINGDFGDWDTQVFVPLGSASNYTSTGRYDPDQPDDISRTPITGYLKLFLNSSYTGANPSVGIDLSLADIGGNTFAYYDRYSYPENFYTMTLHSPQTTNNLSVHTLNSDSSNFCSLNPTSINCQNFDYGNASIDPFPVFGVVEADYDLVLDLGFISFVDTGNGNSILSIGSDNQDISLSFIADDGDVSRKDFLFTSSEVPVPAAAWLMGSGLIGLFGITRRKKKNM